jgi:hypothetical protein
MRLPKVRENATGALHAVIFADKNVGAVELVARSGPGQTLEAAFAP